MTLIELHKQVLLRKIGKKINDETLKDRISMLGTDLNSIDGDKIIVEIFPKRPDMLSEQGFSRAFSSFIGAKTGLRKYKVEKSYEKVIIENSVKDVRPFTACAIVKELEFDDEKIKEIVNIQEKLHASFGRNRKRCAIGIYPLEKIKMPIYYRALKPEEIKFRPLESTKEMNAKQILSQHKAGRQYGHLLEGLKKYPIFIDSNDHILSMPPIINSHLTGKITEQTKDVFIECSGFDLRILQQCLNILVTTLADMNGIVYSMELKYGNKKIITPNLAPKKMKLDIDYVNKILGLNLNNKKIKKLLERMGYEHENEVLVPAYRADVLHQIDLVEDIAIAYGYENFKGKLPEFFTLGEEDRFEVFKNKISQILIGLGLLECFTYHLSNKDIQSVKTNCKLDLIEVKDAKTEDNCLRAWIIPGLLKVLMENKHNEYPQNIFDIGTVFKKGKSETGVVENDRLAVCLCNEEADFTKIKQVLDYLFSQLDLKYEIKDVEHDSFIEGRVGRISVKGKDVAYIGEIHPSVLKNFDLTIPVAALEINLSELFNL